MKKLSAAILFLVSANTYAGFPVETGYITFLQIHKNPDITENAGQRYLVQLSGSASENTCGNDQWTGYFDSGAGRAQYAFLLAALMAGKLEGTAADLCESGALLIRNVYAVL